MTAAKHYTLADPAREDLIEMIKFSEAKFSERQTMKYLKAIHEGTECIGKSQRMFRSRSEFSAESGLSVYSVEKHYNRGAFPINIKSQYDYICNL